MRLTGLFTGRETLISEGQAIANVADNLANLNTTGFKGGRSEFANLLADSEGSLYSTALDPGNGAKIENVQTRFDQQGTFDFTDRSLDAAIDGKGFFVATDGTDNFYTRAGNFGVDENGNLVTEGDLQLLGFTTASPEAPVVLNTAGISGAATPSANASIGGNLNSAAPINPEPAPTSFLALSEASDFVSPLTVIDSLGQTHDISLYFFHTANLTYTVSAYVDGAEVGGTEGAPAAVGTSVITFGSDGKQPEGAGATMLMNAPWVNGASASAVTLDLGQLTDFATPSALSKVDVDGNKAGTPTGYEILNDGTFNVTLDTGDRVKVGNLILATFPNVQGLEKLGKNLYREGDEAGDVTFGTPTTKALGSLVGGALENSNVDPASEFIDLIRYQRAYQAGAQIVTTMSELLNTTIQLA